jgi:predicted nucleic acid-binding protein
MKQKPLIYLESSFWRRLLDHFDSDRRRATYTFLKKVARRSRLRISRMVLAELVAVRDLPLRRQLLRKVYRERVRPVTAGARVDQRVDDFVEAGWLGQGQLADLYHIAYAILGGCDYLVSWDESHLARPWTQRLAEEYCRRNGLKRLRIGTPIEVAERWLGIKIQ